MTPPIDGSIWYAFFLSSLPSLQRYSSFNRNGSHSASDILVLKIGNDFIQQITFICSDIPLAGTVPRANPSLRTKARASSIAIVTQSLVWCALSSLSISSYLGHSKALLEGTLNLGKTFSRILPGSETKFGWQSSKTSRPSTFDKTMVVAFSKLMVNLRVQS